MKQDWTIQEIATILKRTKSAVQKHAYREKWGFTEIPGKGRGGKKRVYNFDSFPEDVKLSISIWYQAQCQVVKVPSDNNLPSSSPANEQQALNQAQEAKALSKADLLRLYEINLKKAPWGQIERYRDEFMEAYNSGLAYPKLFETLGPVNKKTISGWKQKLKRNHGDIFCLADNRGYWKKDKSALTEEQKKIALSCVLHPNRPKVSEAIRMAVAVMKAKGIENIPSKQTYRRWLTHWKKTNYHVWTFNRQGAKAWNDNCAFYIERDYDLINVGDILVADGHVLNFETINPWTGKPKRMMLILWLDMKSNFPLGWEVMPNEDTQAISSALRRAIIRIGKYPKVVYLDNGKAFRGRFFSNTNFDEEGFAGLYRRLGIETIYAWPYHGQSKTVERFFGTFSELERWAPTYSGTSIEHKPPRMMRGERVHRKVYEKAMGGKCLTLEETHKAIAAWFDAYVRRPQRGHLKEQNPLEVFIEGKGPGVDPFELRYLMMSMEIRTIQRNGISFLGQNYYSPELYGRRHSVQIKYDLQDKEAIYVFEQNGNFLCTATPVEKIHPAANILGTEEDKEKLIEHIKFKKQQEKEASVSARAFLENEVLPEHRRMLENRGISSIDSNILSNVKAFREPKKLTDTDKKKIEKDLKALEELNQSTAYPKPEKEFRLEVVDEISNLFKKLPDMSKVDRYEKLIELETQRVSIPKELQKWMGYYESTLEYKQNEEYFNNHRIKLSMMYPVTRAAKA